MANDVVSCPMEVCGDDGGVCGSVESLTRGRTSFGNFVRTLPSTRQRPRGQTSRRFEGKFLGQKKRTGGQWQGGGVVFSQRLGSKVKQVVSKTYNRTGHLNKDFKPDLRDPRHLRIRPPRSPDVRKWNNSCRCRGRPSRGGRRPEWWL